MPQEIIVGGGGGSGGSVYTTVEQIVGLIPSGSSGNLLDISIADPVTNPDDIIVLYALSTTTTSVETGISLDKDGILVWDGVDLSGTTSGRGDYSVGRGGGGGDIDDSNGKLWEVTAKSITISKDAGGTSSAIAYGYEIRRPL